MKIDNSLMYLISLLQLGNSSNSFIKGLLPFIIAFMPIIINLIEELKKYYYNFDSIKNKISIKIPIEEINTSVDGYSSRTTKKICISEEFKAINDYIIENINNIYGIEGLIQILNNTNENYNIENSKSFIFIPNQTTHFTICNEKMIFCKINTIIEGVKKEDDKKEIENKKSYEIELFKIYNNDCLIEKQKCIVTINNFIKLKTDEYKKKNEIKKSDQLKYFEYRDYSKEEYYGIELFFNEYDFETNKNFSNLFLENKNEIIELVSKFKNFGENENPFIDEFKKLGMSYKLTILLHGVPGTGKTTFIKTLAVELNKNIISLNISNIKSNELLTKIIRTTVINKNKFKRSEFMIVIEDCDALDDNFLFTRKKKENNSLNDDSINNDFLNNNTSKILEALNSNKKNDSDLVKLIYQEKLDLSCILNLLDGLIELHGLIIIFSSNHPEKLDEAFKRPGRINLEIEFKRATVNIIKEIIKLKFNFDQSDEKLLNSYLKDYVLSHAEVERAVLNSKNIAECIEKLKIETNNNLYRIEKYNKN